MNEVEPYDEERPEHQWPVHAISEWQEWNDLGWHYDLLAKAEESNERSRKRSTLTAP
jgi:hypothetical protein